MKQLATIRLLLALTWIFPLCLYAQEPLDITHGCNFASADAPSELYAYEASAEAKEIVERIMQMNVLPQNFVLRSADCSNALATVIGKQRYILYSTAFLENFKKEANTQWAAFCVLAHEIGHHLSNHDLEETNPKVRKGFELEADRFAGGVLFRLGATLEQAQAGINTFSSNTDSQTHPPKRARLEAVAVGWKQAEELAPKSENTTGSAEVTSDEKKLYDQAVAEEDPYKAIELLDQAIELKEDYADAYLERGKRKVDIENVDEIRVNYNDALDDYNTYISMRPKNAVAYEARGYANYKLGEKDQALKDFNQAIRLDAKFAEAYIGRAWLKRMQDDYEGAHKDLEKAVQVNPELPEAHFYFGHFLYEYGEYEKAIPRFDKVLKLEPKNIRALGLRAACKMFAGRFAEAVTDYNLEQALDSAEFFSYFDRGQCYQSLGKHREAIADFTALLRKVPTSSDAFLRRGVSRQVLGQKEAAEEDYKSVFENTVLVKNARATIGCLLIEYGLVKEGLVWLDKLLAESPDNKQALECKRKAEGK